MQFHSRTSKFGTKLSINDKSYNWNDHTCKEADTYKRSLNWYQPEMLIRIIIIVILAWASIRTRPWWGGGGVGGHTVFIGPPPALKVTQVLKKLMTLFSFFKNFGSIFQTRDMGTLVHLWQACKQQQKKQRLMRAHMQKRSSFNE